MPDLEDNPVIDDTSATTASVAIADPPVSTKFFANSSSSLVLKISLRVSTLVCAIFLRYPSAPFVDILTEEANLSQLLEFITLISSILLPLTAHLLCRTATWFLNSSLKFSPTKPIIITHLSYCNLKVYC